MKANNFKAFRNAVNNVNSNDDVWYMGFLWLQLTNRQVNIIINDLIKRDDCSECYINGRKGVKVPSGMILLIDN